MIGQCEGTQGLRFKSKWTFSSAGRCDAIGEGMGISQFRDLDDRKIQNEGRRE